MLLLWQHYGYLSSSHVNDYVCEGSLTQVTYRYNILQECQILDTIFDSVVENLKKKRDQNISQGREPLPHLHMCSFTALLQTWHYMFWSHRVDKVSIIK